jgi:hypothetical protein
LSRFRVGLSVISSRFVESVCHYGSIVAGFCNSKMSASSSSKVLALQVRVQGSWSRVVRSRFVRGKVVRRRVVRSRFVRGKVIRRRVVQRRVVGSSCVDPSLPLFSVNRGSHLSLR